MPRTIDDTDRQILTILRTEATLSKAEIARRVQLAPSAVFERIRRLEEDNVIRGYGAAIDPAVFGHGLTVYVQVEEIKPAPARKTGARLAKLAGVEEVHRIAGEDCFLMKVRLADTAELARFLDTVGALPSVGRTRTTLVIETVVDAANPLPRK